MSTRNAPPLPLLLAQLRRGAEIRGTPRGVQLSHGARVAFKVTATHIMFAVSRPDRRIGDTELLTFRAAAGVPGHAVRIPADGQEMIDGGDARTWFRVGWRWPR